MITSPIFRGVLWGGSLALGLLLACEARAEEALVASTATASAALPASLPAIAESVPAVTEQASLAAPQSSSTQAQSWFNRLFAPASHDARQQAVEQIEAMGFTLNANSWIRAVAARNGRLIDLFKRSGFDLNSRGDHERTAILTAALGQDWAGVADLLKTGVSPNGGDDLGTTPLMAAAMLNHQPTILALLKAGADVAALDGEGHSALHYAVAAKKKDAVRALIDAGAPVVSAKADGNDVLSRAFASNEKEIIALVLQARNADCVWNSEARSYLTASITARDAEMTQLILSKFPVAPTPEGQPQPILAYAILSNDLATFQYLLQCGASPDTLVNSPVDKTFSEQVPSAFCRSYLEGDTGISMLMLAAGLDRIEFVRALLEKGGKRFLTSAKYKMVPLYFAAHLENPQVMQLLISGAPSPQEMRIEISLGSQRMYLYRNNVNVFSAPCSTGKSGFGTPAGRYVVTDKHLSHKSSIYKVPMPFFMRLNCRDFGMHEGNLPGYPASHGCIRLPGGAARQLYRDVPLGTLVSITR